MPPYSKLVSGLRSLLSRGDSRISRAVDQGYDIGAPIFHGSPKNISFDDLKSNRGKVFYAGEPDIANLYTAGFNIPYQHRSKGQVLPLLHRGEVSKLDMNLFKFNTDMEKFFQDIGLPQKDIYKIRDKVIKNRIKELDAWRDKYGQSEPDYYDRRVKELVDEGISNENIRAFLDSKEARNSLSKHNLPTLEFNYPITKNASKENPGIIYGLSSDTYPDQQYFNHSYNPPHPYTVEHRKSYVTFNPERLRSPFAEFDPEFVGKPGLMKRRGGLVHLR
jgi:hypothetical protein